MRFIALLLLAVLAYTPARSADNDQINTDKAIAYFQSGKYHEAKLLLEQLNARYQLNVRYKAYLGLCYYKDEEFDKCCACMDTLIQHLGMLAPEEQNVYCYAVAESHFKQGEYTKALPFYEQMLLLCSQIERADVLYMMGFCYYLQKINTLAAEYWERSLCYYRQYAARLPYSSQRIKQLENMLGGIKEVTKQ